MPDRPSPHVTCPKGHAIVLYVEDPESVKRIVAGSGQYYCKSCDQEWPMTQDEYAGFKRWMATWQAPHA